MKKHLLYLFIILFLTNCSDDMKPLNTVEYVDIERYLGKWYEIARLPNSFEKGLICCTAEYSMRDDGKIKVLNSGHTEKDTEKIKTASGKAWLPDQSITSQLKVQFFGLSEETIIFFTSTMIISMCLWVRPTESTYGCSAGHLQLKMRYTMN